MVYTLQDATVEEIMDNEREKLQCILEAQQKVMELEDLIRKKQKSSIQHVISWVSLRSADDLFMLFTSTVDFKQMTSRFQTNVPAWKPSFCHFSCKHTLLWLIEVLIVMRQS